MKDNKTGLFWVSFSDILLSLFFVILVLFIFTFLKLKQQNVKLEKKVEKLNFLNQVEEDMKALSEGDSFEYNPSLKKYILKERISYAMGSSKIPDESKLNLLRAGRKIRDLLEELKSKSEQRNQKVKYLLILEGMASKDNYAGNFELSYKRAKSVFDFWSDENIDFDENVVEILISGSGTLGTVRSSDESQNQSIMVQIIPKNIPEYAKKPDEPIEMNQP